MKALSCGRTAPVDEGQGEGVRGAQYESVRRRFRKSRGGGRRDVVVGKAGGAGSGNRGNEEVFELEPHQGRGCDANKKGAFKQALIVIHS